jgi:hypothetical protein
VAGAWDFDLVAFGSCGVPPFEVGIDGSVFSRHQHPAWLASPRSRGDGCLKIVSEVDTCDSCHESRLLSRQVGCKVLMKLRGVEVSETVCRLLYRGRLAQVTWEALSVVSLVLSSVCHVDRDVHQAGYPARPRLLQRVRCLDRETSRSKDLRKVAAYNLPEARKAIPCKQRLPSCRNSTTQRKDREFAVRPPLEFSRSLTVRPCEPFTFIVAGQTIHGSRPQLRQSRPRRLVPPKSELK